ncbi:hypothetical protein PspLS_00131 [Pyricularia sp. CBS 133598]|nr:hypothetical protein PspLS_00131 [Pyricularia sp. CBS 133598]
MSEAEKKVTTAPEAEAAPVAAQPPTDPTPVVADTPTIAVSTETAQEKASKDETPASIAAIAEPAASEAAAAPKESAPATAAVVPKEPAAASEETKAPAAETATTPTPAAAPSAVAETAKEKDAADSPAAGEKTAVAKLWEVCQAHEHKEIWGVTLQDPSSDVPTEIVLTKFLNANDGDVPKAVDQLTKTLDWRNKMKPLELLKKSFPRAKFGGLGYVTTHSEAADSKDPALKEVFTWNIYGNVKSMEETFGDLQQFIEWRVALMELALQELNIAGASAPHNITAESDPYKIYQVHDYKSISFLRQPPSVKAASKETISVFSTVYPELLKEKFFVNVPVVMGFMYGLMKLFVAPKTLKKFHPMSDGGALAREFGGSKVKSLGDAMPKEYGGKGEELNASGKETMLE